MGNDLNEIAKQVDVPHIFTPLTSKQSVCTRCSHPEEHSIHVDEKPPAYVPNMEKVTVYESHQS